MVIHCPSCSSENCFYDKTHLKIRYLRCFDCDFVFSELPRTSVISPGVDDEYTKKWKTFFHALRTTKIGQRIVIDRALFPRREQSSNLEPHSPTLGYLSRVCHKHGFSDFKIDFESKHFSAKKIGSKNKSISIVMPIFNEAETCERVIRSLLDAGNQFDNFELIIVESNSSDGTKEIVSKFEDSALVKIVFQDEARGKGHAVRAGIAMAKNTYISIYDGDEEYNVQDFHQLINFAINSGDPFILGYRVAKNKINGVREFKNAKFIQHYMNFGHVIVRFLLNRICGYEMKDPFTMFKIFRRDMINMVDLKSDRFDLDLEIVIKLIGLGVFPTERPSEYLSRSHSEGKKVRLVRDPITWLNLLFKLSILK